jgi:hypothetical protein
MKRDPHTDYQEPHIKRGHPIVFGLILLFAFIEACLTSWLGEYSFTALD